MKKRSFVLVAAVFAAAVLLFSCKSAPEPEAVDPLLLLDRNAALYMYIPVQEYLPLMTSALTQMSGMSEKDAERIASRTEVLYMASENTKGRQIFQLSAKGNYPLRFVKKALSKPDSGWTVNFTDATRVPYDYYASAQTGIQISLPSSQNAIVSWDVAPQISMYDVAVEEQSLVMVGAALPSAVPAGFNKDAYEFLTTGAPNEIRFYECKADSFLQDMLQTDMKLPLKSVAGTFMNSKKTDAEYEAKIILEVKDATPAKMKALVAGLKLALFPMPAKIQQTSASHITISEIAIGKDVAQLIFK